MTIEELTRMVMKTLGKELLIVRIPPRSRDITHGAIDISKIVRLIQFKLSLLGEGLKKTLSELRFYDPRILVPGNPVVEQILK
ncbi:MAG: hypothetical protein QXL96_09245 [Ignisphaera sp.]